MTWLADVDPETFWAHHAWTDFGPAKIDDHAVAVLPIYGFSDHGLGLPLDAEESLGGSVLKRAVLQTRRAAHVRVLPPLRFCLTPYPSGVFGVDYDTAHALVSEISHGVRAAGYQKLAFYVTSPWNVEFIDTVSRDVRAGEGLQTFVVNFNRLGLSFHPAAAERALTQSAAARRLGFTPRPVARNAPFNDLGLRPGDFRELPALAIGPPVDGGQAARLAGDRLADILLEAAARPPLHGGMRRNGLVATRLEEDLDTDGPAFPDGLRSRYLGALSREEWDKLPGRGEAWVLLPTGSIEQHGPHLPVGVDAILAQGWVTQVMGLFPAGARVVVAPPITYGKSNEHGSFPGTLSISGGTLRRLLLAMVTQLKAAGFRKFALLNTHGGNSAVLVTVARELQGSLGVRIGLLGKPFKPELSEQETEFGFHAGEWETSLMLALAPGLVAMDRAVTEYPGRRDDGACIRLNDSAAYLSWLTSDISESGVMGDARAATSEKGRRWLEEGAAALARKLSGLDGV